MAYVYGERVIDPRSLAVGDTFHHWSPTGGNWRVTAVSETGVKVVSDMRAVRNLTWEKIASHGNVYLKDRAQENAA